MNLLTSTKVTEYTVTPAPTWVSILIIGLVVVAAIIIGVIVWRRKHK